MYSRVTHDAFDVYRPVGVPVAEGEEEFSLMEYPYLSPFHIDCMQTTLIRHNKVLPDPDKARRVLTAILHRYEKLRSEGRHDGPPIKAVKLYKFHWDIIGTDLETARDPHEVSILMEVGLDSSTEPQ